MSKFERLISHGWFWIALTCTLVGLVYIVSGFNSGFSTAHLSVLLVPLAFYALAVKTFGEGSVIEMGFAALIVAVLVAMLVPIFDRIQHPQKRPWRPILANPLKSSKNPQKPSLRWGSQPRL